MIPLEHLHPMILHFPIVLIILLFISDAVALWRGVPLSGRGTYAVVSAAIAVLAGVSAAVTAMLGDVAAEIAVSRGVAASLIEPHEDLGSTTAIVLGAWAALRAFLWWRGVDLSGKRVLGVVSTDVAICALVFATAYLGGQLVYDHGVNVVTAAG